MAKAKSTAPKTDNTLNKVIDDFNSSWEYTSGSWHNRWQDNYYLYNNQRVKYGYEGITDTFVPMAFGTIETLTSGLFGSKPKFNFISPSDKPDQKTDILNGLIDFYWDKDQWSIKVINTGRTGLMLGTGIDYFYWENDHPCLINVPLRDFFIDPTATSLETAHFMGRRFLTTKEDLESFEIVDPETGVMEKKYKNLDKINAEGETGDPLDKEEKDMWYGSTVTEAEKSQIEVIEYWTKDKVISVANRSTVIQDDENPFLAKAKANGVAYPEGLMPFNGFRDYVDPSLFYAKGEIDFISDEQELLNDITNQNIDAVTFALNPMFTLDPKYAHLIQQIENIPGAVYPTEAGALQPIQMAQVPADAFNERTNLKNEIRETTASNEVVRGVKTDSTATATEINAQIAGAGQRINLKITQIENEYFHRMAKIVFELIKLYVTEPMMVRILGDDGARWEEFDPEDFQGDYEPRVQLDIEVQNKRLEEAANAKELMAAFLGDPDVNQLELKKKVLQKGFQLDPDEVDLLMTPPEGEIDPMTGMPIDPMMEDPMGGMPVEDPMELPSEEMMAEEFVPEEVIEPVPLPEEVAAEEQPMILDPVTGELIPVVVE